MQIILNQHIILFVYFRFLFAQKMNVLIIVLAAIMVEVTYLQERSYLTY
jgi:LPS O-antigen subunit length determinant protein (WzzB/FepE family)